MRCAARRPSSRAVTKKAPPDDRHRIQLAMRPLLVEGSWGRMLVDCGVGEKMSAKDRDIYALDRSRTLEDALTAVNTFVANPFTGMQVSSKVRPRSLQTDAPALMVACGLAMRRIGRL